MRDGNGTVDIWIWPKRFFSKLIEDLFADSRRAINCSDYGKVISRAYPAIVAQVAIKKSQ